MYVYRGNLGNNFEGRVYYFFLRHSSAVRAFGQRMEFFRVIESNCLQQIRHENLTKANLARADDKYLWISVTFAHADGVFVFLERQTLYKKTQFFYSNEIFSQRLVSMNFHGIKLNLRAESLMGRDQ